MITNSRVPDSWEKIDGLDFYNECKKEYRKRYRTMWREFIKSKINPEKVVKRTKGEGGEEK